MVNRREGVVLPYPWIEGMTREQQKQIYEDFQALGRQGTGTRWATLVIAAADSTQASKNKADYICNGSNDVEQVQTAVDLITSRDQPGRIVFLEGTYTFTDTLELDLGAGQELMLVGLTGGYTQPNCKIIGPGTDSAILLNGADLFTATPFPHFAFANMAITNPGNVGVELEHNTYASVTMTDCVVSGSIAMTTSFNTLLSNLQGARYTDCVFSATGSSWVVDFGSCSGVVFDGCQFSGNSAGGVTFGAAGGDAGIPTVKNCIFSGGGSHGIRVLHDSFSSAPQYRPLIINNKVEGYTTGIYVELTEAPYIHGNFVYNCSSIGIEWEGGDIYGNLYGVVSGNFVLSCGTGVYLERNTQRASVVGNTTRNCTTSFRIGSGCDDTIDLSNDWGTGAIVDSGTGSLHYSPGAVTDFIALHRLRVNSTGTVFSRHRFNFIGDGITIVAVDDPANDEVDVTFTSSITSAIAAKGDLLVGLAAGSLDNLPVDRDGQILVTDSGTLMGVKWGPKLTVSKDAPTDPRPGDIWLDLP